MSDEMARKIYARLDWVLIWLFIIAMNTCHTTKTPDPIPVASPSGN